MPPLAPGAPPGEISGTARFDVAWPPRRATAELAIEHPLDGIDRGTAQVRLDGGVVHIDPLEILSGASRAVVRAEVPLAALAPRAGPLRETLSGYASGPIALRVEGIDLAVLRPVLRLPAAFPSLSGSVNGQVLLDLDRLPSSSGSVEARGFALELDGYRVAAEGPIRIDLRDGRAVLAPTALRSTAANAPGEQRAEISGSLDLARDWSPEQGLP